MDISDKIREQREAVQKIAADEQLVRRRIEELKQILAEKSKRQESLAVLLQEESKLLDQLK